MAADSIGSEDLQTLLANVCATAEEVVRRSANLLSEYQQLKDLCQQHRTGRVAIIPGQSVLAHSVKTEHDAATRILDDLGHFSTDDTNIERLDAIGHLREKLECSNVPSLETAWGVVKRCTGLEQLRSKFSLHASVGPCSICKGGKKCPPKGQQTKSLVHVDAVVRGGAEWLRIIGMDERQLLHEMAEAGWDWGAEDGSDDDDDECDVPIVETIRQLVAAARANRHDHRPPGLHVILTRIAEGSGAEIDRLIRKVRTIPSLGVQVRIDCSNSEFLASPAPPLEVALQSLVTKDLSNITQTVNLDCTILVALASDINHSEVQLQPWHHRNMAFQIREEAEVGSSLVKEVYPVLRSRSIVCTAKAAERFWDSVMMVAAKTEIARAELFLPRSGTGKSSEELVAELQALSNHHIEPDLRLPVEVVEFEDSLDDVTACIETAKLPRSAKLVYTVPLRNSELNLNIFFYGWLHGATTMTANNAFAKEINLLVERNRTDDDDVCPNIWVVSHNRSLATKGRPPAEANLTGFRKKKSNV